MSSGVYGARADKSTSDVPRKKSSRGASERAKGGAPNLWRGTVAAVVTVVVAAILLLVFLPGASPLAGMYVTTDGRRLELRENGTARYGVTYKNIWMKATYKWSASGKALKITLAGVPQSQPGYRIESNRLVGNGGVWVKR